MEEKSLLKSIYLIAILLIVTLPFGDSIRCYECTSMPNSGCGENFGLNYVGVVDCMENLNKLDFYNQPRMCKKEIQKTSDGIRIVRGCLQLHELQEFETNNICETKPYNQDVICRCDTDLCNAAITLIPAQIPLITALCIFSLILWFR